MEITKGKVWLLIIINIIIILQIQLTTQQKQIRVLRIEVAPDVYRRASQMDTLSLVSSAKNIIPLDGGVMDPDVPFLSEATQPAVRAERTRSASNSQHGRMFDSQSSMPMDFGQMLFGISPDHSNQQSIRSNQMSGGMLPDHLRSQQHDVQQREPVTHDSNFNPMNNRQAQQPVSGLNMYSRMNRNSGMFGSDFQQMNNMHNMNNMNNMNNMDNMNGVDMMNPFDPFMNQGTDPFFSGLFNMGGEEMEGNPFMMHNHQLMNLAMRQFMQQSQANQNSRQSNLRQQNNRQPNARERQMIDEALTGSVTSSADRNANVERMRNDMIGANNKHTLTDQRSAIPNVNTHVTKSPPKIVFEGSPITVFSTVPTEKPFTDLPLEKPLTDLSLLLGPPPTNPSLRGSGRPMDELSMILDPPTTEVPFFIPPDEFKQRGPNRNKGVTEQPTTSAEGRNRVVPSTVVMEVTKILPTKSTSRQEKVITQSRSKHGQIRKEVITFDNPHGSRVVEVHIESNRPDLTKGLLMDLLTSPALQMASGQPNSAPASLLSILTGQHQQVQPTINVEVSRQTTMSSDPSPSQVIISDPADPNGEGKEHILPGIPIPDLIDGFTSPSTQTIKINNENIPMKRKKTHKNPQRQSHSITVMPEIIPAENIDLDIFPVSNQDKDFKGVIQNPKTSSKQLPAIQENGEIIGKPVVVDQTFSPKENKELHTNEISNEKGRSDVPIGNTNTVDNKKKIHTVVPSPKDSIELPLLADYKPVEINNSSLDVGSGDMRISMNETIDLNTENQTGDITVQGNNTTDIINTKADKKSKDASKKDKKAGENKNDKKKRDKKKSRKSKKRKSSKKSKKSKKSKDKRDKKDKNSSKSTSNDKETSKT